MLHSFIATVYHVNDDHTFYSILQPYNMTNSKLNTVAPYYTIKFTCDYCIFFNKCFWKTILIWAFLQFIKNSQLHNVIVQ